MSDKRVEKAMLSFIDRIEERVENMLKKSEDQIELTVCAFNERKGIVDFGVQLEPSNGEGVFLQINSGLVLDIAYFDETAERFIKYFNERNKNSQINLKVLENAIH